jgi:hypothetical protein
MPGVEWLSGLAAVLPPAVGRRPGIGASACRTSSGRSPLGRRRAGCAREEAPGPLAVRILPDEDRVHEQGQRHREDGPWGQDRGPDDDGLERGGDAGTDRVADDRGTSSGVRVTSRG